FARDFADALSEKCIGPNRRQENEKQKNLRQPTQISCPPVRDAPSTIATSPGMPSYHSTSNLIGTCFCFNH
ncbi:hypothetical protein JXO59_14045, partial [candidate division KSB1 bacterium]|nr:hypothetical protein [candidate division KSB1 bacterium]